MNMFIFDVYLVSLRELFFHVTCPFTILMAHQFFSNFCEVVFSQFCQLLKFILIVTTILFHRSGDSSDTHI